jgi:hypothetical protein
LQLVGPEGIGEIVERMATQSPRAREEFAKLKEQLKSK